MAEPVLPYRERLRVPWSWWAMAAAALAVTCVAFAVASPPVVWAVGLALAAPAVAWLLIGYGGPLLQVDDSGLRAGRAYLPRAYVGEAVPLDAEETRRLAGVDADARAYLLLRPYCAGAVRVEVADDDDPTPYWLLSSRDPGRLAEGLAAIRVQDWRRP